MYFIFSLLFSLFLIIFLRPILSKFVKDIPNKRSSHENIIPSGGGTIFIIPLMIYAFYSSNFVFISLLPLIIISFLDDIFKISPLCRAFIQAVTVVIIFNLISNLSIFISQPFFLIITPIVIFGLTLINTFNFMDGLDGLLAGCFLIILLRYNLSYNKEISILIGSLIPFIIYNWSPAKIFMGDVGSTFLGAIYFIILLSSLNYSQLIMNLLIATPLLVDATSCIFLRILKKQNIFLPHKLHLYQRLNQAGMTHSKISIIYIGATFFLAIISITENNMLLLLSSIFIVLMGFLINKKYAIKFN